jgi:hypothetical protein
MVDVRLAGYSPFTLVVYLMVAIVSGIVAFTASAGVVDSIPIASVAACTGIVVATMWLRRLVGFADALTRRSMGRRSPIEFGGRARI